MAKGDAATPACEDPTGQEERPFKCKQCPRSYRHAGSLLNHQRTHEVGLYPCLVCHKDFSNPMALKSHLRTHLKGKRRKCPDCGRSFSQLAGHRCAAHVRRDREAEEEEEEEEEEGSNGGSCAFQKGQDTSSSSEADTCSKREKRSRSLLTNLEKYIAESVVPADFSQLHFPGKVKTEEEGLLLMHQEEGEEEGEEEEEEEEEAGSRLTAADERRYKCNQCDKAYKHPGSLATHKQSHSLGLHQCAMCPKAFSSPVALKSHARLHSEYRPYKCRFCHVAFRLPSELLSHQQAHGPGEEGSRTAEPRSWEGSEQGLWEEEGSIETLAKLDIYQPLPAGTDVRESAPCSLRDPSRDGGGERRNPGGELCVRCGGTFAGEEELKGHRCLCPEEGKEEEEEEGEEGSSPSQPAPGPNGAWEASLKAWESYGLYEERPFRCDDCGRTYRHAGSLINHKKSHQIGVYSCTVCSKQLYNLAALKNHLRVHLKSKLGSPPAPEDAPPHPPAPAENQREAGDAGGLPRPAARDVWGGAPGPKEEEERGADGGEEGEEEERPYRCGDCGRSYRHRGSLVNHRHTHQTGIFQCSICPKQYSNLMALRNHVRVHLRAARMRGREHGGGLTCGSCGESFEEEEGFQLHQLRHMPCAEDLEAAAAVPPKLAVFYSQEEELLRAIKQDVEALENGSAVAEDVVPASEASHACPPRGVALAGSPGSRDHALRHRVKSEPPPPDGAPETDESPVPTLRLYGCDQCGKSYRHSGSLINHKQTHQTGDFSCSACGKHFQNVASLKSHLRGHQRPRRGPAEAAAVITNEEEGSGVENGTAVLGELPLGGEFESSPEVLEEGPGADGWQPESQQAPSSLHGDPEARPCVCDQCGLGFDEADSLTIHRQTHQLGIYQCSLCPKEYPSLLALKSHFHGHGRATASAWGEGEAEEQPFLCSLCGMIFPSEDSLQHHHSLAHDEGEAQGGEQDGVPKGEPEEQLMEGAGGREEEPLLSHICGYCGQTFDDMASLEEHSEGHLEEKAAALADTSVLLRRAPRPEEEAPAPLPPPPLPPPELPCHAHEPLDSRPYACGQCGKTYRHGGSLVNHKKIHQIGNYQCAICCRLYPNLSAYRNHLRNHPRCKLNGSTPELCPPGPAEGGEEPTPAYEGADESALDGGGAAPPVKEEPSWAPAADSPAVEERSRAARELSPSPREPRKAPLFDICGEVYEGKTVLEGHWPPRPAEEEVKKEGEVTPAGEGTGPATEEEGSLSERPFRCDACGRRYKHAGSLINHKQTHKMGFFHCYVCQKQFYNLMALKNHNRTHFETKRYRCSECPKAFRLQKQLAGHQRVHQDRAEGAASPHPAQPPPAQAKRAGRGAESAARPPRQPPDPKERPYRCGECSRTYRHAGSLLNHQKSHKVGHFTCGLCGKAYPNLMSLKNHQRIHYEVKRHQCPDCGKAFKWERQLLRHRRRPRPCGGGGSIAPGPEANGNERAPGPEEEEEQEGSSNSARAAAAPFACRACPRRFPSPAALKSHARVHAKRRLERSEGGKGCWSAKDLAGRRRKRRREAAADGGQGGEAPAPAPAPSSEGATPAEERPYKCDSCERTYRHAGSLLNHQQVHAAGLYRCPMCQKEFHNRLALKSHLRLHKNKKRHWCSRCGKHFRTSKRLAAHARVHGVEQKGGEGTPACPTAGSKRFCQQTSIRRDWLSRAKEDGHPAS